VTDPQPTTTPTDWVDLHGDVMYRYALRRLGDPADAEDAVQDALLGAMNAKFDGRSSERTWLIGILKFKVIDRMRARYRDASFDIGPDEEGHYCTGHADPLTSIESDEVRAKLLAAVDDLPSPMREVVLLHLIDGHPTEIVCKVLGLTPTNCWTIVHRARKRLRGVLDSLGERQ
jgi:RNA polymerase sigma-70 factor (ECF subfamily)